MEVLLVLGVLGLGAFGVYWLVWLGPTTRWRWQLEAVARQLCPRCKAPIGMVEAEAAYERAAEFARAHVLARVTPESYSSVPVVCSSCNAASTFWRATGELRLSGEKRPRRKQ